MHALKRSINSRPAPGACCKRRGPCRCLPYIRNSWRGGCLGAAAACLTAGNREEGEIRLEEQAWCQRSMALAGRRRRTPSVPLQRAAGATAGAAWGLPALLYEFQKM